MAKHIAEDAAAVVKTVTLAEAKKLPNMLGRIAPAMLKANGVYRCTIGEVKTKFVLAR